MFFKLVFSLSKHTFSKFNPTIKHESNKLWSLKHYHKLLLFHVSLFTVQFCLFHANLFVSCPKIKKTLFCVKFLCYNLLEHSSNRLQFKVRCEFARCCILDDWCSSPGPGAFEAKEACPRTVNNNTNFKFTFNFYKAF